HNITDVYLFLVGSNRMKKY
ncbi:hypothetical protein AZZ82_003730, partial [Klebsiella aerogenes]